MEISKKQFTILMQICALYMFCITFSFNIGGQNEILQKDFVCSCGAQLRLWRGY